MTYVRSLALSVLLYLMTFDFAWSLEKSLWLDRVDSIPVLSVRQEIIRRYTKSRDGLIDSNNALSTLVSFRNHGRTVAESTYLLSLAIDAYNAYPASPTDLTDEFRENWDQFCTDNWDKYVKLCSYVPFAMGQLGASNEFYTGMITMYAASARRTDVLYEYLSRQNWLDEFFDPPSMRLEEIDFENPTHYQELLAYMEANQHLFSEGVTPSVSAFHKPLEPVLVMTEDRIAKRYQPAKYEQDLAVHKQLRAEKETAKLAQSAPITDILAETQHCAFIARRFVWFGQQYCVPEESFVDEAYADSARPGDLPVAGRWLAVWLRLSLAGKVFFGLVVPLLVLFGGRSAYREYRKMRGKT